VPGGCLVLRSPSSDSLPEADIAAIPWLVVDLVALGHLGKRTRGFLHGGMTTELYGLETRNSLQGSSPSGRIHMRNRRPLSTPARLLSTLLFDAEPPWDIATAICHRNDRSRLAPRTNKVIYLRVHARRSHVGPARGSSHTAILEASPDFGHFGADSGLHPWANASLVGLDSLSLLGPFPARPELKGKKYLTRPKMMLA
jgi:hypothetical protein